jgi:Protein of unknown function (DUF3800)
MEAQTSARLKITQPPTPMAIFQAFLDESGKFKDKRVVSFCGFVSPQMRVREFEDEWNGLLKQFELQCLTIKRALRHKIPFSPNTQAKSAKERNEAFVPFIKCIRKHFEMGIAITVDVDAYNKWPHQAKKRIGGSEDPHYFAFLCALTGASKYVRQGDKFSLICDDDKATAMTCYGLYTRARTINPELRHKLVSITFADDDVFVPLQAADLLASLSRLEAARQFHRDYYEYMPSFDALTGQGSGMNWGVSFYDKDRLNALGSQLVKHK